MYCLIYKLIHLFLKLLSHSLIALKQVTFCTGFWGVFQDVSMQHLSFSHITASKMLSLANSFLFIQTNNSFSTYSFACYDCITHLATLALMMISLCIKILLIVHFASNKSKKTNKQTNSQTKQCKNIHSTISRDSNSVRFDCKLTCILSFGCVLRDVFCPVADT